MMQKFYESVVKDNFCLFFSLFYDSLSQYKAVNK